MAGEDGDTGRPENDNPADDDADDDETDTGTDDDADDDSDDDDDSGDADKDSKKDPELAKAIRTRDRIKRENRRLKAELEAKNKKDDDAPDPVAQANTKLVRTAAHGVLRGLGVESKEDRIEILDMLKLDDVSVDDDGADEDEIEDRINLLRRAFGGKQTPPGRNVPRSTKKTTGGKDTQTDPDAARYRRIMAGK